MDRGARDRGASKGGVVEALDRDGVEFGENRLLSEVKSNQCMSAADLLNQIMSSVREFASGAEQVDDITALVVRLDAVSVTTPCVAAV